MAVVLTPSATRDCLSSILRAGQDSLAVSLPLHAQRSRAATALRVPAMPARQARKGRDTIAAVAAVWVNPCTARICALRRPEGLREITSEHGSIVAAIHWGICLPSRALLPTCKTVLKSVLWCKTCRMARKKRSHYPASRRDIQAMHYSHAATVVRGLAMPARHARKRQRHDCRSGGRMGQPMHCAHLRSAPV